MSGNAFALVELLVVVGLAVAFFVWQFRSVKRDSDAAAERERQASATRSDATESEKTDSESDR